MCGLAGCYAPRATRDKDSLTAIAHDMAATLVHRGPDAGGVWVSSEAGIALAHRRLSIVDLSPTGSQPMVSACGRFVLAYNGEVYNHAELRERLQSETGCIFRGHSDTEVLVEAWSAWGAEETLRRVNGMFAFAVWDTHERQLTLVRDRVGIKPLYYGWRGETFLFGSELKALRSHPEFTSDVDRDSLAVFLEQGYFPAPCTVERGIRRLPAGQMLVLTPQTTAASTTPHAYWSLRDVISEGDRSSFTGSYGDGRAELHRLLRDSVRLRVQADVPVGAFLSGGIDSSLVVALMQAQATHRVRAFTIGFEESDFDEARFATQIADRLGVEHVIEVVTESHLRDLIPRLPDLHDEPFGDSSALPTYAVSRLARQSVVVSLSGDGGDELLGGYRRYFRFRQLWRRIAWLPRPMRRAAARIYASLIHRTLRRRRDPSFRARALAAADRRALYEQLHRHWEAGGRLVIGGRVEQSGFDAAEHWVQREHFVEEMMAYDTTTYLPEDILTKVDRASMAVSLEARVPLLDHRVLEFLWSLPAEWKFDPHAQDASGGKRLLRDLLSEHVPRAMFERPKTGFGVPLADWLRGPLRDWAEELLSERRLNSAGLLDPEPIRRRWEEHLGGATDWSYLLWDVLMVQAWEETR